MGVARTAEDYRLQLRGLLPAGPAWDPELVPEIDQVLTGLSLELARLDGRGSDLLTEMDPHRVLELLPDWERVAGLPDKCSGTLEETIQGRRSALISKIESTGGQSPGYFIEVAARLGYEITITEFRPFRAGLSVAGDALTNGDWVFTWQVNAPETTVVEFRAGLSVAGERLRTWGNSALECKINQIKPAHTIAIFAYGE